MNATIGQILLWAGFLSGALATVFSTANYARVGINVTSNGDKTRVLAKSIGTDSPGFKAGIRDGDELRSINGEPVKSPSEFAKMLGRIDKEAVAKIVYARDGKETTTNVNVRHPWSTVNWPWYLISAGVCIAGICFLRIGKKSATGNAEKTQASLKQIKLHLADAINNSETLVNQFKDLKPRQILTFIEDNLQDDLSGFAEGRDSITDEFGLETFANVMTQFAAGERAINRAWSASADGYVEEAATCINHGMAMLKSAKKLLDAAG